MGKELWKPGNMLYPLPAVMVSLADQEGHPNIITLAWVGTVCTNPPMVSISVRPERYSYPILKETGEFVINLTTKELVYATDYCGVRSGRDVDKFKEMKLTAVPASVVKAPMIGESPVNIECKVRQIMPLGSHDMFLADVVAVHADEKIYGREPQVPSGTGGTDHVFPWILLWLRRIIGHLRVQCPEKKNLTFGTKSDIIYMNIYLLRRSSIRQASGAFFMRKVWVSV